MKSGRHRGLESLARISHCASALTHTFPKAAFLQFCNTIYGMQVLVLHIRSRSRWEAEALLVAKKCAPLLSKTLSCGSALMSTCMSSTCPIMWCRQTASPHSCHSRLCLQLPLKAIRFIFIIIWTWPDIWPYINYILLPSKLAHTACKSLVLVWPAKAKILTHLISWGIKIDSSVLLLHLIYQNYIIKQV